MTRPLLQRYSSDEATRLRTHYAPYYKTFEKQSATRVYLEGRQLLMLASNDYLGLAWHPAVIEAGGAALRAWGCSPTGSRMANGSRAYHQALEESLAGFLGKEAVHVFSAGYLACMAATATLPQKHDLILADKNIHSSLVSGISLSPAQTLRFSHNNPADLREILSHEAPSTAKFLVVEGIYSMEGHLCELPALLQATQGQNTLTILDDAHGLGVMGLQGRGSAHHFGLQDQVDLLCGSFSKSLGSVGGYIAGSKTLIEYIRTHAKPLIFSAALPPASAAAAQKSLELLQSEPEHIERLWQNTRRYHALLKDLKLDTWGSASPATPLVIGDRLRAFRFWQKLLDEGVFTVLSVSPAVPPGKDLIRTAISAAHTDDDFLLLEKALRKAVKVL